jgi:hypothetical protein
MVLGALGNFLCRGLIWGTVWMVLGGFGGVRQFFCIEG